MLVRGRSPLEAEDLGLCPCGQKIAADREAGAVIHGMPPCKAYLELDPIAFMRYVRRARGISES